jgi:hypothetical protein
MLIGFLSLLGFTGFALMGILLGKRRAYRQAYLDEMSCVDLDTLPVAQARASRARTSRPAGAKRIGKAKHAARPRLHAGLMAR